MKLFTASLAIFLLLCALQHDMAQARARGLHAKGMAKKTLAPALLTFGDSIIDPGNNNELQTILKCNFPPYGRDFVTHKPTGRFCNGKIPTDFLASKLGLKELLPAYLTPNLTNQDLLTGVSFASGGAGFDPMTSQIGVYKRWGKFFLKNKDDIMLLKSVISLPAQLEKYMEYQGKVRTILGAKKTAEHIKMSIYGIIAGSDDVANTYFGPIPIRKMQYDLSSYANLMVNGASSFIESLIKLGARRIAIIGVPPIGCVPSQRTLGGGLMRDCQSGQNELARLYNARIAEEVGKIDQRHKNLNLTLIYADIYDFLYDMMMHPKNFGFEVSTIGCCGTGLMEVSILCNPLTPTICSNVSKHVFWDSYHPTEGAYKVLSDYIFQKLVPYLNA